VDKLAPRARHEMLNNLLPAHISIGRQAGDRIFGFQAKQQRSHLRNMTSKAMLAWMRAGMKITAASMSLQIAKRLIEE
jgi:hypothetical protein